MARLVRRLARPQDRPLTRRVPGGPGSDLIDGGDRDLGGTSVGVICAWRLQASSLEGLDWRRWQLGMTSIALNCIYCMWCASFERVSELC